jgi:hypothetical protein
MKKIGPFKEGAGNWVQYRQLPGLEELDFHYSEYGPREIPYWEAMSQVYAKALDALKSAFADGKKYLLIRHGWSTSRRGATTARSQAVQRILHWGQCAAGSSV